MHQDKVIWSWNCFKACPQTWVIDETAREQRSELAEESLGRHKAIFLTFLIKVLKYTRHDLLGSAFAVLSQEQGCEARTTGGEKNEAHSPPPKPQVKCHFGTQLLAQKQFKVL